MEGRFLLYPTLVLSPLICSCWRASGRLRNYAYWSMVSSSSSYHSHPALIDPAEPIALPLSHTRFGLLSLERK